VDLGAYIVGTPLGLTLTFSTAAAVSRPQAKLMEFQLMALGPPTPLRLLLSEAADMLSGLLRYRTFSRLWAQSAEQN
jgi:hypothetical protein